MWTDFVKKQVPEYVDKDDGVFWISFKDYEKFFYVTTICFYNSDFRASYVVDEPEEDIYSLCKLTLNTDVEKMLSLTINQIDARFVDDTMKGQYNYAPIKLIVTKI